MNNFVRNISPSSKYYGLEGLVGMETDKSYLVIWFKLLNPENKRKYEFYVRERPFLTSKVLKSSVEVIPKSELTIKNKNVAINMAKIHATHLILDYKPKKYLTKGRGEELENFYEDIDPALLIYQ